MKYLDGMFEFLSDDWYAEAQRYLDKTKLELKESFSISGRYLEPPPHLGGDADMLAWTFRWDGTKAVITRSFDESADQVIVADYQAALYAAQWVGNLVPGAAAKRDRELAVLFGADAVRVRGVLPPAAQEAVALFADHMARQTVENPDLEHRARRLGISHKVREMEEQGFTVLENAISPEFADEIRDATLRAILPHQKTALMWMLYQGPEFEQIIQHPTMMTLVDASLGRGATIGSFSAISRGPAPGFIPLHTDYSHIPEPYPEFALTGVGVWALEDWTLESGPTWIIPGSHKLRRPPRRDEEVSGGVPILMPKGSVVFFTHGVWHWQGDRTQPGNRVTLHMHFNRGILRSLEPLRTDVQLLNRNPPRLAEMLGQHDWFEKLSPHGRDYARLAYMDNLLAFNEDKKRQILNGQAAETVARVRDLTALVKQGETRQEALR